MKNITQFIKESVSWVGSGWESYTTLQLTKKHLYDKLTTENIKNHLKDLVDNYKWNKFKNEWVDKETDSSKDSVDVTEKMLRNIKLNKEIEFGSIAFGSGRQTTKAEGYVKIGEKSKEGKILYLEYCENESEAIDLPTVGDLLDLIYKYKEVKPVTPAGVLNTKYANSINIRFTNDFSEGQLGILKFKS